jgi:hypothetical protein
VRLGNPDDLQLAATCVWLFELPYGTMVHYLRFCGGLHIPSSSVSAVYGSPFLHHHDLNLDAGSMGHIRASIASQHCGKREKKNRTDIFLLGWLAGWPVRNGDGG